MSIKMLVCLAIVAIQLAGCITNPMPTEDEMRNADYGSPPEDYQDVVTTYVKQILIDPNSAMFEGWRGPSQGWYRGYGQLVFGYRVAVWVNSKNRMGGYAGRKLHFFLIRNGGVVVHDGGDYRHGTVGEQRIHQLCNF